MMVTSMVFQIGAHNYAPANNSLERTGDAATKAREGGDLGSRNAMSGSDPRPLSSQPLGASCYDATNVPPVVLE